MRKEGREERRRSNANRKGRREVKIVEVAVGVEVARQQELAEV